MTDISPAAYLYWYGSELRIECRCSCGHEWRADQMAGYRMRCASCGTEYELPATLQLRRVEQPVSGTAVMRED